jgi:small subunit ribosomal protein S6
MSITYEAMLAFNPNLDEEGLATLLDNLKEIITREGGVVVQEKDLGKKKFAYPVRKFQSGHYHLLYFSGPPTAISELERILKLSEDVLRFLTVKLEEKALKHSLSVLEEAPPAEKGEEN